MSIHSYVIYSQCIISLKNVYHDCLIVLVLWILCFLFFSCCWLHLYELNHMIQKTISSLKSLFGFRSNIMDRLIFLYIPPLVGNKLSQSYLDVILIWYYMVHTSCMLIDYYNNLFYDTNMIFLEIYVCVYWKQVCSKCLDVELVVCMNGSNIKNNWLI